MTLREHDARLEHDPARVVARFFLPGDGLPSSHSRVAQIIERVLAAPRAQIEQKAAELVADLSTRHADAAQLLVDNATALISRVYVAGELTEAQTLVLGATFTAEYAVEGAALCNPSAVEHPSQEGLEPGQLRVAIATRCIGEGHISSIGFAEAVIDESGVWTFAPRARPLTLPRILGTDWSRDHFGRALEHDGHLDDLTDALLSTLPERLTAPELEAALLELPGQLAARPDSREPVRAMRDMIASTYRAEFPRHAPLSGRVLLPVAAEENHGMEDARFVRFTDSDGIAGYRATYTAYDGRAIAPRLITSPDLVDFTIHRLTGSGAHNKGMALFPRLIGQHHFALSRTDGENISLARSSDGVIWEDRGIVHRPTEQWELVQLGNCGAPIETGGGWLVLTHGVGPLRTYSLGAILLDLDDPSRVIARSAEPLLGPAGDLADGYVPRVVYSCGPIVHGGTLWVPVGVGDSHIRMFSIAMDELLDSLLRTPSLSSSG
ncbi:glycosylase [Microbacterium sp. CFBP9034]|uniref:glycoside hydrolase family 130 protein n=1 Tax=Microbacterium sp. CFBP9034 TaxID=3096540 RepID=UPI002A69FD41|nr:glycosylase [Microbacterium sp. CFBP9034]MDY0909383.1 glycosylase [Microbacterium sp. CFBP9034]